MQMEKAALVLAHDERRIKKSNIIIPIFRTVVNGMAAGLVGLSIAMLVVVGAGAFTVAFALAAVLAFLGERYG